MYKHNNKNWIALTIITFITLHLRIFSFFGFEVSISFFLLPIWLIKTFYIQHFNNEVKLIIFSLILLPLLYIPVLSNIVEFYRTFALYVVSVVLFFLFAYKRTCLISSKDLLTAIQSFQLILLATTIVQFISVEYLGIESLYNIWGKYQLHHQLPLSPWEEVQRMKAFYLEPSYLAVIVINCYWYVLYLNRKITYLNFFLSLFLIFLSSSAFGLLTFTLLTLHFLILKNTKINNIFLFLFLLFIAISYWDIIAPYTKLDTLFKQGKVYDSTFMRLVAPIWVLQEIWNDGYFLGVGFGQYESYYDKIIGYKYGETGISNGIYLLLAYFGVIGILLYLFIIIKYFFSKKNITRAFILLVILNLSNSGAIFSPQFIFFSLLLPIVIINLDKERVDTGGIMRKKWLLF